MLVAMTFKTTGSDFDDLRPWALTLNEGISRNFYGELTVVSETAHTPDALKVLLDNKASLSVTEGLPGGGQRTRTRYLHGILTACAAGGAFKLGGQQYFRYFFTIEGHLARLRYSRRERSFDAKTPKDIITTILEDYGTDIPIPNLTKVEQSYSSKLIFNQRDESDWDFVRNICAMYGISFLYTHQPPSQSNGLGDPSLSFSASGSFPDDPVIVYSDGTDPSSADFALITVAGKETMNEWRIQSSIGVEGIVVTANYPNANYGSSSWKRPSAFVDKGRFHSIRSLFHGYQRDIPNNEVDADVDFTLNALSCALNLKKQFRQGKAPHITLQPGFIANVDYGGNGVDTVMITESRLFCRTAFPFNNSGDTGQTEEITVEVKAMDYSDATANERRFCSLYEDKEEKNGN